MIPKLQTSERFLNDYAQYQERIKKITDSNLQNELTGLLIKLKEQVVYIDRSHESMFITGRVTSEITDLRSTIVTIKKNLDQKLAYWERTQA